eukprot:scaffold111334_cov34-Tisochrysis_lutea.AAC.4
MLSGERYPFDDTSPFAWAPRASPCPIGSLSTYKLWLSCVYSAFASPLFSQGEGGGCCRSAKLHASSRRRSRSSRRMLLAARLARAGSAVIYDLTYFTCEDLSHNMGLLRPWSRLWARSLGQTP